MRKIIEELKKEHKKIYKRNTISVSIFLDYVVKYSQKNNELNVLNFLKKYDMNLDIFKRELKIIIDNIDGFEKDEFNDFSFDIPMEELVQLAMEIDNDFFIEKAENEIQMDFSLQSFFIAFNNFLQENGTSVDDKIKLVYNSILKSGFKFKSFLDDLDSRLDSIAGEVDEESPQQRKKRKDNILNDLCINLNERAKQEEIHDAIGRDSEIKEAIVRLEKFKKPNVVLLGKPGVGKTTIPEGLACRIVRGDVPDDIKNMVIFQLNIADSVAGTKFRGEFEEKIKDLVEALDKLKKSKECDPVLFIDEIHGMMGAGGSQNLDLGNMIKPHIASGRIRVIGATTEEEWSKFIENDGALQRRFHKIYVYEPTRDEAINILMHAKAPFEKKHNVSFDEDSIKRIVDLSMQFIKDTALPDKAFDLMDYTGAYHKIHNLPKEIKSEMIEDSLAQYKKIPVKIIREKSVEQSYKSINPLIKKDVFAQDHAVDKIVKVFERSVAGLKRHDKPIGSFLLLGPTGVGKTELAKSLAKHMNAHLIRIDCSELQDAISVNKLIGAPPAFIGHDQPSLLKEINKHDYCVLLMDEFDKAHEKIHELFLQAMDNAKITDSRQHEISFRNVLILYTTNDGARHSSVISLGDSSVEAKAKGAKLSKTISDKYAPEFRNRLTDIIFFNPLRLQDVERIVSKHINTINEVYLKAKNLTVFLEKSAIDWIIENSYSETMGARPIERFIDNHIVDMLTQDILSGKTKGKNNIVVLYEDGELKFEYLHKIDKKEEVLS